jgi:hypothetical protein
VLPIAALFMMFLMISLQLRLLNWDTEKIFTNKIIAIQLIGFVLMPLHWVVGMLCCIARPTYATTAGSGLRADTDNGRKTH